jgi:hypothetical protein
VLHTRASTGLLIVLLAGSSIDGHAIAQIDIGVTKRIMESPLDRKPLR